MTSMPGWCCRRAIPVALAQEAARYRFQVATLDLAPSEEEDGTACCSGRADTHALHQRGKQLIPPAEVSKFIHKEIGPRI